MAATTVSQAVKFDVVCLELESVLCFSFESEFFKSFFSSWESDKVAIDFTKDGHFASAANASVRKIPYSYRI